MRGAPRTKARLVGLAGALAALGLLAGSPRTSGQEGGQPAQPWPPLKGERFPDVTLKDPSGEEVRLSSLEGKVLVVEPIGLNCPACQAFAGAHEAGSFRGVTPQEGLPSFEELLDRFAGVDLASEEDLVYVQLLLYDMKARDAPPPEEARAWAEHFPVTEEPNTVVLVGDARYVNRASYAMIPGFFVIDRDFVLRKDGTGHDPQDHPYRSLELIPELLGDG